MSDGMHYLLLADEKGRERYVNMSFVTNFAVENWNGNEKWSTLYLSDGTSIYFRAEETKIIVNYLRSKTAAWDYNNPLHQPKEN